MTQVLKLTGVSSYGGNPALKGTILVKGQTARFDDEVAERLLEKARPGPQEVGPIPYFTEAEGEKVTFDFSTPKPAQKPADTGIPVASDSAPPADESDAGQEEEDTATDTAPPAAAPAKTVARTSQRSGKKS